MNIPEVETSKQVGHNLYIDLWNRRLVSATNEYGYAIKTYDDGSGQLWVYSEVHGPMGVVRAQSWDDAYSICQDEIMIPVPEEDLLEAYGLYTITLSTGAVALCADTNFHPNVLRTHIADFGNRHAVLNWYPTEECATSAGLAYIQSEELDLVEGYEYQGNASGTGIVSYDLNGQDLRPLSDSDNLTIVTEEW